MPRSVKPQLQSQLPAAAKLAELQPCFAFHSPTPIPVPVDSMLQLTQASNQNHSWLSKQWVACSKLEGSLLKQALYCISSTELYLYANYELMLSQASSFSDS